MNTATKVHVFYTDPHNGWCAMYCDDSDYQVGEAEYGYRKSDVIAAAKQCNLPMHIFGKNNLLQRLA